MGGLLVRDAPYPVRVRKARDDSEFDPAESVRGVYMGLMDLLKGLRVREFRRELSLKERLSHADYQVVFDWWHALVRLELVEPREVEEMFARMVESKDVRMLVMMVHQAVRRKNEGQ